MRHSFLLALLIPVFFGLSDLSEITGDANISPHFLPVPEKIDGESWAYFLQHLPVVVAPIVDYTGRPVRNQEKHVGIIPYDVGTKDLQQCADALIRLRAEYLFGQHLYKGIGFHFTDGQYFSYIDYCKGVRPIDRDNHLHFVQNATPSENSHFSLRRYLDIVYAYAGTVSLSRELKPARQFAIGTIVIHRGSPGHCFIITDEAMTTNREKVFKLVEGYMPAQSIYMLRNLKENGISPWYKLKAGSVIETASYVFKEYQLKQF